LIITGLIPVIVFLKRLEFALAKPLSIVYAHMFTVGKIANITPVFKHGISSDVSNYRPISSTSAFYKIFERILKQQMLAYWLENNLITRQQFVFLLFKCSTCTQLLNSVNDWTLSVRDRRSAGGQNINGLFVYFCDLYVLLTVGLYMYLYFAFLLAACNRLNLPFVWAWRQS